MPSIQRSASALLPRSLALLILLAAWTAAAWAAAVPPDPRNIDIPSLTRPVELAGAFLVHPGDNPAFADPAFDDSAWATLTGTRSLNSIGIREQDFVWYRLHVRVPQHTRNLAFMLTNFTGSQQIFVNGILTGPSRSFAGGGFASPNFDLTARIPDALTDSGTLLIAIRADIHNGRHSLAAQPGFAANSRLLLGDASDIEDKLTLDTFFNYTSNVTDLLFTIFTLIITLTLWLALRKEQEYLYLAVYLAGAIYSESLNILSSRYDLRLSRASIAIGTIMNVVSLLGGLEFARIVLRLPRRRWILTYESIIATTTLLSGIVSLITHDSGAPPLSVLWVMLALYMLLAGSLGLGLPIFALYLWRKTRNFDALLLSIPILARGLVFYLTIGYDVFAIFHYGAVRSLPNPPFGRFGVSWSEVTDFIFLLALLLFLILRTLRLARARAALAAEIAAAQSVQQLLLSRSARRTPGFHVETQYYPASAVGGDFFLVTPEASDGSLLVLVGDVSGKGLSAAMRVAMILGVLRREPSREPALILANLNQALLTDDGSGDPAQVGFTTACCLHLTATGAFTIANAGHISPYLSEGRTHVQELVAPPALPLGLAPDQAYTQTTGHLAPQQRITLLSDGVPEARNATGTLYGFDRLPELLQQPAAEIAATARSFGQEDDITVLTIALA